MSDGEWGLAGTFAEVARTLLGLDTVHDTLGVITGLAVHLVDGCDEAGVSLAHPGGRVDTPAAAGELAETLDALEYRLGEGPCVDAIRDQPVLSVDEMAAEARWPRFAPRAAALGVSSMLSFRLFTYDDVLGALNLYAYKPHAFDDHANQAGMIFASHAAVALASALTEANLRQAISTRQTIGEAIGILMERHKDTAEDAFDRLSQGSQDGNIKLRDLASRVVETGEDPSAFTG